MESIVNRWKRNHAPATTHQRIYKLRRMLKAIDREDLLQVARATSVPMPRTVIATPDEIARILAAAAPPLRAAVTLGVSLGLRIKETMDVRESNFDAQKRTITFVAKGGEIHTMPTTSAVEELIRTAPKGPKETPIVFRYHRNKPMGLNALHQAWRKARREAGVNPSLSFHDLRRTVAVTTYEITRDLRAVEQILRHKNLETTTRYLEHKDQEGIRPILEQLWKPATEREQ